MGEPESPPLKKLLTIPQVAEYLDMHEQTVRKMIRLKELPSFKVRDRRYVLAEQLAKFIDDHVA